SAGKDQNTFVLTAADPSSTPQPTGTTGDTSAPPRKAEIKTVEYTLVPEAGVDLKSLIGKTVEVSGAESSPQAGVNTTENSSSTTSTTGTAGAAGITGA